MICSPFCGVVVPNEETKIEMNAKSDTYRLLILDGVAMEWQTITLPRNPTCPACATRPDY